MLADSKAGSAGDALVVVDTRFDLSIVEIGNIGFADGADPDTSVAPLTLDGIG